MTERAELFPVSLPTVSKDLKELERAGDSRALARPSGGTTGSRRSAQGGRPPVEHDRRFWEQSFDRLENYLRELQWREEMAARRGAATMAEERELVITRIFDAPRSLVFKVWTAPEHLARWWGPKGFTTLSCAMDVRAGGAWVRRMRSPEGSLHTKRGIYREIVAPERLVFSYADEDEDGELGPETLVTVTFEEHGAKTRLTLRQSGFETVTARDGHYGGWTSCMERFADYLATL